MKCSLCHKDGYRSNNKKFHPEEKSISFTLPTEEMLIISLSKLNTEKVTNSLFDELLSKVKKDKLRKVCKNCNELGHNTTSISCKINIDNNIKLKQKIKNYILSQNWLDNKTTDEYCTELSVLLDITPNLCRSLYNEIPLNELLDIPINIEAYLKNIKQLSKKYNVHSN